ncbi:MAG: glycosyltransferase family 39 protein [Candidatus Yanofskybacteria bacterium]|nr:glycosyltransferase family 39 protein [Candidatus Yanofskybacteria bacterium]
MNLSRLIKFFAGVIIVVAVILAVSSVWNDSIIVDEVPHIGAGYSYLVKQDMRLNPEHPPLAKDLAAIPLLFVNLKQDVFNSEFWQTDINGQWNFGRRLIFNSGNDADLIKHLAKLPMLSFFILSAILIFKWARKLYGNTGGITALILFAFSPTVITHSRFVTTDLPALFGILFATYFYIKFLKDQTRKNSLLAAVFFGIALLLKFSTFLLVPFFVLLALIYGFVKNPRPADNKAPWFLAKVKDAAKSVWATILIFIIGFVVIVWPVYYFHTYNYPPERQHRDTQELLSSYGNRMFANPVVWASDKPVIRAAAQYGLGLLMVNQRAVGGNTTYFLGEVSRFGWHKYFPIVYLIKEPLAWWGMVLMALFFAAWQWRYPLKEWVNREYHFIRNHIDEFAMLLWLLLYWGISINSTLNIGVRHLLPVYPFAILLVSGQISKLVKSLKLKVQNESSKIKKILFTFYFLLFTLLGWYVYENVRVYPYYLTYFNQIVGGPSEGHKYVVDSNLDWGQDLVRFSNWVKKNNIPKIEFDYFGWADPSYYLKERYIWMSSTKYNDGRDFTAHNQSDGWLAVSATFLMGSQGPEDMPNKINYLWLNSYQPVTIIGNSIFVYRIR